MARKHATTPRTRTSKGRKQKHSQPQNMDHPPRTCTRVHAPEKQPHKYLHRHPAILAVGSPPLKPLTAAFLAAAPLPASFEALIDLLQHSSTTSIYVQPSWLWARPYPHHYLQHFWLEGFCQHAII
eukprot:1161921-Pelagomonas_calceolata.AAC.23